MVWRDKRRGDGRVEKLRDAPSGSEWQLTFTPQFLNNAGLFLRGAGGPEDGADQLKRPHLGTDLVEAS
jgi:hypothetical protein